MVDVGGRIAHIVSMVHAGKYFVIHKPRQYGKTTVLSVLRKTLESEYTVIYMDFQALGHASFETEHVFVRAFSRLLLRKIGYGLSVPESVQEKLTACIGLNDSQLIDLFDIIYYWCSISDKKIVLIIDEIDSATNSQILLDFLSQLREGYISRETEGRAVFQSVILAGVIDIKNIQRKIRDDADHRINSPWNIASEFTVSMRFKPHEIASMLEEYANDHHKHFDRARVSQEISNFTNGYPFLVSRLCQIIDEYPFSWDIVGVSAAAGVLVKENNTLFDSIMAKVHGNATLRNLLQKILFAGTYIAYNPDDIYLTDAINYGFIQRSQDQILIANRIFETRLYRYFLYSLETRQEIPVFSDEADKMQFVRNGRLQMEYVLSRYIEIYDDLYHDKNEMFSEEEGRRRFLLFINGIINGKGNFYIEAQTRNRERMDLVVDYAGERFIIELKIWRGNSYNERGEKQIAGYLDYFHIKKGYMLSYNFNKNKKKGIRRITIGDMLIIEAIV